MIERDSVGVSECLSVRVSVLEYVSALVWE